MKYILVLFISINFLFAFNLKPTTTSILSLDGNKAIIDKGNLKNGQSGVLIHTFKNQQQIILAYGVVTKSNENNSTIKLLDDEILEQNAIPTTTIKPSTNDTFVLNHLYDTTLLIAPNYEVYQKVQRVFYKLRYIQTDTYAGFLKIEESPVPSIKLFQEFSKANNIGLLLMVVENELHIIDTISLKILASYPIQYKDTSTALPFYTNVEGIKTGLFDFSTKESIQDYHKYYKKLLGLNNDGK